MTSSSTLIGQSLPRVGLDAKVAGGADYTADLKRPGMLYGRILRSPHPHARVVRIDASRALALPGVHAVVTYEDVPADVRIDADLAPLDRTLRFVGDEVAVIAAESESLAEDALALIDVEYEVLAPVFDSDEALGLGAPKLHPNGNLVGGSVLDVMRGNTDAGQGWQAPLASSRGASTPRCTGRWAWRRAPHSLSGMAITSRSGRRAVPSTPSTATRCPASAACRWRTCA
jgi:CO/xanthine dehydrogenase Mo-binding subunit